VRKKTKEGPGKLRIGKPKRNAKKTREKNGMQWRSAGGTSNITGRNADIMLDPPLRQKLTVLALLFQRRVI
jgi:hypothetical protein